MRRTIAITLLTIAASSVWFSLIATTGAHAAVVLIDQQRLIRVTEDGEHSCAPETDPWCVCDPAGPWYPFCSAIPPAGPFTLVDEASAFDFSPFDETVTATVSGATETVPIATAMQTSSISTSIIEGVGAIDADSIFDFVVGPPVSTTTRAGSTARSELIVEFEVTDDPIAYAFDGTANGYRPAFGHVALVMRITDGVDTVAEHICEPDPFHHPTFICSTPGETLRGVLAPGSYTLEVVAETDGDPGELGGMPATFGEADYAFRLGFGPASAVPGLGWLGRIAVACGIALGAGGFRWRG